jgi:hypothetical protein
MPMRKQIRSSVESQESAQVDVAFQHRFQLLHMDARTAACATMLVVTQAAKRHTCDLS